MIPSKSLIVNRGNNTLQDMKQVVLIVSTHLYKEYDKYTDDK